jgi:serine/threonine protein kinase
VLVHSSAGTAGSHGPNLLMQTISIWFLLRSIFSVLLDVLNFSSSPVVLKLVDFLNIYSMQAIDFLDKLLRYDHQDRLTAREAMVILLELIH